MSMMNELDHLFTRFNSLIDPSVSSALFAAAPSGNHCARSFIPPPPRHALYTPPLHAPNSLLPVLHARHELERGNDDDCCCRR